MKSYRLIDEADITQLFTMEMLPEEDVTGYALRSSLATGQSSELILPSTISRATKRPGWVLPSGLNTVAPQFGLSVTPEEIYQNHTRGPLMEKFLNNEERALLFHHHFQKAVPGLAGLVGLTNRTTRGRMAMCPECIEADLRLNGYAIWRRLWLMPGVMACPVHQRVLLTYCNVCEAENRRLRTNWAPNLRCVCGQSLKAVNTMSSRAEELAIGVATMAYQGLQKNFGSDLSGTAVTQALRYHYGNTRIGLQSPHMRLAEAFGDIAGPDALRLFGVKNLTLRRLVGDAPADGPIRHPIQVLAALHVSFGGFLGFEKATRSISGNFEFAMERKWPAPMKVGRQGNRKLGGQRYIAWYKSHSQIRQDEITSAAKDWLMSQIEEHPGFKRTDAWRSRTPRRFFHMRHLNLLEHEWLANVLPLTEPNSSKPTLSSRDVALAVAHIKGRYDDLISIRPLTRISKSYLLTLLDCDVAPKVVLRSREVRAALAKYVDDIPKRRLRVTDWICAEVEKREPGHRYGESLRYTACSYLSFKKNYQKAKKWLEKFDSR